MSHFHLTLPSNASMKYYPGNTVAKYTTKLSNRIELDGDWEVGLAEIIYPNSWYNMKEEYMKEYIWKNSQLERGLYDYNHKIRAGHYQNPAQIIKECDWRFHKAKFTYDDITKKFTIHVPINNKLRISKRLSTMLGFDGKELFQNNELSDMHEGQNAVDLNSGFHSIFVYCDIVESIPVGDTTAPLMRAVNIRGKYGDVIQRAFDSPIYLPVQKKQFDTIEVNIMTDTGQPVPFEFGKSLVTLHFRRSSNPYFLPR
jgi:hypothetical protein